MSNRRPRPTTTTTTTTTTTDASANDPILTDVLYGLSAKRGPENDEMQGEINGLAAASGLPVEFVTSIQMMYELQTIMVPIVNFR